MADDIDSLLSARASADDGDIDALLSARASSEAPSGPRQDPLSPARMKEFEQYKNRDRSLPWYSRAATGAMDPVVGAGQLMQHIIPDAALNAGRKVTDTLINAAAGGDVDTSHTSAADFDAMVRRREAGYQAKREGAGQSGLDWWRVGGAVANPVSWLAPEGSAGAGIMTAVANGAKAGLFQALMQPVTADGNFLVNKGVQEAIGAAAGGTLGAALHALRPVFGRAADFIGRAFRGADDSAQAAGAAKITDDVLTAAGADPAKVDPNLYGAIRTEVQDALKAGVTPDPKVMTNRADASALPVPVNLTRGQASRDPLQFSWEVNTSKIAGAGEELNQRIAEQNRQLIENLNVLGAKGAPSQFDAAKQIVGHLEGVDKALRDKIDEAYSAVRNSAGQSALKDAQAFHGAARQALESQQLTEFVPDTIAKQYNALIQGNLPLTVDIAQTLDKVWGAEQRAAQGSAKAAIGALRRALDDAPISDQMGEASMAAYKVAKGLAKQRFDLIDNSPAFKAITEGVEPDKFFGKYVQGANVSELGALKQLVGPDNVRLLQQTTLGNLKRAALNKASDENGVFSQSAYNRILQDPVQAPRLAELFSDAPETLGHLYRIGRVAENVQAFPKGHSVNTSNTAPTAANIVRDIAKSEGGSIVTSMLPRWLSGLIETGKEGAARAEVSRTVQEALSPGVTASPVKPAPPSAEVKRLTDLLVRTGAAGAAAASTRDERKE